MILGILLGNTSLKYGTFDGQHILESGRIPWSDLASRGAELDRVARDAAVSEVIIGSVRDDLLEAIASRFAERLPVSVARRDFPLPIENRYEAPEQVGTDRLLNALAAAERAPGRGAIVVDFGTAISISVVGDDRAFLGGPIAGGSTAILRGLSVLTPRLPEIGVGAVTSAGAFLQRNTEGALGCGVFWQVAGGVDAMIRGLLAEVSFSPRVIATGGGAPFFVPALSRIDEEVPDLTLEGLLLAGRGRELPRADAPADGA